MSDIAHFEISPGTIRFTECPECSGEQATFDAVSIGPNGVAYIGTIRRCPGCETPN